jgi:hypothetical protein
VFSNPARWFTPPVPAPVGRHEGLCPPQADRRTRHRLRRERSAATVFLLDQSHRRCYRRVMIRITPIVAVAALAATAAHAQSLPVPKPPGPGGSCPHGYATSGSFCVPSAGAQDAIAKPANRTCPWGWTSSGSYCLRSGSGRR